MLYATSALLQRNLGQRSALSVLVYSVCVNLEPLQIVWLRFSVLSNFSTTPRFNDVQFTNECVGQVCPLSLITGFKPGLIRFCLMHTVHLGICHWINASCVYDLAERGYLGEGSLQDKLDNLCRRFNLWCSLNKIRHYQPYIPVAILLVPPGEYPELRLKAWTSRVLSAFLSVAMQDMVGHMDGHPVLYWPRRLCRSFVSGCFSWSKALGI